MQRPEPKEHTVRRHPWRQLAIDVFLPSVPNQGNLHCRQPRAPTDNHKWAVLTEFALAHFPEDEEVAGAMRRAEELAGQQPRDAAAFVAATEAVV
jgi:hypothetical protein